MENTLAPAEEATPTPSPPKLTDIEVKNENIALNIMVSFLNAAQRRGAFSIDESAKIWECIQIFANNNKGDDKMDTTA